jgi:Mg2+/Co2+ transporter CorC
MRHGALLGVVIAFVAISISKFAIPYNYAYIPDAVASVMIGCILCFLGVYLFKNNVQSLTGVSAGPHVEKLIRELTNNVYGVSRLVDLKTIDMGSSGLIVNMKIEVNPEIPMKDADDIAQKVEQKIKKAVKRIADITIEMIANDISENWRDKFEAVIAEGKSQEILTTNESKILQKFFDFTNTVAFEIMVPRTNVVFVDADASISELTDLIIDSGHTRIPVYKDVVDNVIGVINAKDVLFAIKNNNDDIKIESLAREIHIIPETKPISDLLNEFTSTKTQFALVIDEHGGVAGIVTIEDILEEIVGEIYDEFDTVESAEYQKVDKQTLWVDSKMEIEELNEKFDLDLSSEDYQTIGGYVFGLLGREPEENDEVEENDLKFIINEVDGHKISRLTIIKEDGFVEKSTEDKNPEE